MTVHMPPRPHHRLAALILLGHLLLGAGAVAASDKSQAGAPQNADSEETQTATTPRFHGDTEVVASRIAGDPSLVGRREVILTRQEIDELPVQSVQDLLAVLPGLGLVRRGARGVQGDLNLRGGTFEQAVILVNGVRVTNPQTGHHNLDLFLPTAAIDRVEVLYGPGSAAHGPDAFGGAINIVTSAPVASAFLRFGSHHLTGGGVAGSLSNGAWAAVEREVHTGFRDNTEAAVNQAAAGWSWRRGDTAVDLTLAAGKRAFGAHAFYSAAFPDEWEQTSGRLLTLRADVPVKSVRLGVTLRADRHTDLFVLDRARPDWYRNSHRTRGALLGLNLGGSLRGWDWVVGAEGARDEIDSSNLGRHHRVRVGGYTEVGRFDGPLTGSVQLRLDHQDPWGDVGLVAAGGAWRINERWRVRFSHGQSFRAPSFTELYYRSPATVGNSELGPERGRTSEVGVDASPWSLTLFERSAHPLIDYVLGDDGVWRAANLGRVRTRGAEAAALLPGSGRLFWQRFGVVYLDSSLDTDPGRSRYVLGHPELEAAWTGAIRINNDWRSGWAARWRRPAESGSWSTLDIRLERRILEGMSIVLEANNVLDRKITELHGVPLPGRWITLTVEYRRERP